MDDKNVVKKRVTLAIAFAVFLLAVIVIIVLIKPITGQRFRSRHRRRLKSILRYITVVL